MWRRMRSSRFNFWISRLRVAVICEDGDIFRDRWNETRIP